MELSVLDTRAHSASYNMELDKTILKDLDPDGLPILHLYEWEKPSITYGHFARVVDLLDIEGCNKLKVDVAKRVTGGGATLHFCDFAFSFFMPKNHSEFSANTLKNYAFVNQFVKGAYLKVNPRLKDLEFYQDEKCINNEPCHNFCMAKPTQYDVVIGQKKIGGAAQRKTSKGYLHHGTISIALPNKEILHQILKDKKEVFEAIYAHSYYLVDDHLKNKELEKYRLEIKQALIESFEVF